MAFGPNVIAENDPLPGITLGLLDIFLSIGSLSLDYPKHLENFLSILSFSQPLRIFFLSMSVVMSSSLPLRNLLKYGCETLNVLEIFLSIGMKPSTS
jgi:hypothetical protein